ncbi:extracellular solute-binding protein [Actinoplanes sp. KI2]|uniref:extracellular solute-binding protein n=1 Tax=Actinoplanes sp. KI2 TaxID=2983315 RepID=UPI0021D58D46|nr:extracellular solute-binding protein [Actinoplanes sp. KI2]MCU7728458.1 extracellular solute-binding protein [Actinoplanes sp. KI2]
MRIRSVGMIATALAVALTAAACGGNDSSGSGDKKTATDPASLSATLTWWDTSDPKNEGPAFQELIKKFNATYPNVKIDYQSVPFGDAQNKFKTAAAAKSGAPDILRAEVAWVPELASLGYLYNLDGSDLLKDESDFLPTPMSADKYEGKTYGVPQVTDSLALLYNKKMFEAAGITAAPKTWAEVKTAAAAIKSKTGKQGLFINSGGYFLLPFIYGEGGDMVDASAKKITVNSPQSVAGVKIAQDLVKDGTAVKPPANDAYGNMMTLFKEQKVAMIINGPWEVNNIKDAPTFGGLDNLGIAPVPAGSAKSGAPVGGHNYTIWSGMSQDKVAAAVAFVKFMSSAESQAFIASKLGLLPTRKSAYDLPGVKDNATIAAFKPVLDSAVARPWIPEGGQFFGPMDKMAVEVLVQNKDPKASLDTVAKTYKSEVVKDYSN